MLAFLKSDMKTVVVAVTASLVTATVTTLVLGSVEIADAHGDAHAQYAHNAGKLQGSAPRAFVKENSVLWATVTQEGTLISGDGAVSAERLTDSADGRYHVRFNRDVRECAWQATIASNETWVGFIEVEPGTNHEVDTLFVGTRNSDGNNGNLPFHLLVTC